MKTISATCRFTTSETGSEDRRGPRLDWVIGCLNELREAFGPELELQKVRFESLSTGSLGCSGTHEVTADFTVAEIRPSAEKRHQERVQKIQGGGNGTED